MTLRFSYFLLKTAATLKPDIQNEFFFTKLQPNMSFKLIGAKPMSEFEIYFLEPMSWILWNDPI